jgi:tripartite-type tricarboxylate transporter receptor subunit TctC
MARLLAIAAAFAFAAGSAAAQDFPKHPLTMIVPFAAGGASDVIARSVADQMSVALGQSIVIENVAGAGGSIALRRPRARSPTATPSRSAMPAPVRRPTRSIRTCRSRRIPSCRSPWWPRPSA